MRYNAITREVSIRVTITGDTAPALAAAVQAILEKYPETQKPGTGAVAPVPGRTVCDASRAPGGIHP